MAENTDAKPRIFAWINSGKGTEWVMTVALHEDGRCLGEHCSSSNAWARHDIEHMHASDYAKACPGGYVFEFVDDPRSHLGLMAAYAANQSRRESSDDVEGVDHGRD